MIKGVNRQMIEILDTGSPYFERALLVVQTDLADVAADTLEQEAKNLLKSADGCSHLRRARRKITIDRILLVLGSALLGAAVTILLMRI